MRIGEESLENGFTNCAANGARPAVLRIKRSELLWIAQRLGPDADRGVGMTELMPIAMEPQNLHGAASAARRVIDIGRPWLRFLATGMAELQSITTSGTALVGAPSEADATLRLRQSASTQQSSLNMIGSIEAALMVDR